MTFDCSSSCSLLFYYIYFELCVTGKKMAWKRDVEHDFSVFRKAKDQYCWTPEQQRASKVTERDVGLESDKLALA